MTTKKINGFAAPYRSKTFRDETNAVVGRNGILRIDRDVYEENDSVVIPPFEVVQEGMIISKDNVTHINKPQFLKPPYYVTVSALSAINRDDLIFQFAKSPQDIGYNEVILAEYDGTEWRQPPRASIQGLIQDLNLERIEKGQVGPYQGLMTIESGANYLNTTGLLFDKTGDKIRFDKDFLTPIIPSDPETTWRRVDRIVYRRPTDSANRIGIRKLVVGGSYAPSGDKVIHKTILSTGTSTTSSPQAVIASDNTVMAFYAVGFGSSIDIYFSRFSSDRSVLLSSGVVLSGLSSNQFSVAIDHLDKAHIVYVQNKDIKHAILDNSGALVFGPFVVSGLNNQSSNPKIAIDPSFTKVFIAFEYLQNPNNRQIYLATRSFTGAVITPPIRVTSTQTDVLNPSIDISDDLLVYLAYQELSTIKYTVLDDIGGLVREPVTVSGNTGSTSFGTLIHQASEPWIKVTDNRSVFCLFRQKKSASDYGVTIYNSNQAFLLNLTNQAENISAFSAYVDSFNNDIYLSVCQSSSLSYVLVKDFLVEDYEIIQNTGAQGSFVIKDNLGSLAHIWSDVAPGSFSNIGQPKALGHIGPVAIAGALSTLVLAENQFSISSVMTIMLQPGMQVSLAGSQEGNDDNYIITSVNLQSVDTEGDVYIIGLSAPLPSTESPASVVMAQFAIPDANITHFAKSVADVDSARALRITTLDSDIILARISWPDPVILNYIPTTGAGINSDLFGMYGDVEVDWSATSANTFTMASGAHIIDLVSSRVYGINGGSFPMVEGTALYVEVGGSSSSITPQVSPINALPWAQPIQILGFVKNGEFNPHLFSVAGMGQLDVGESIVIGEDLSRTLRIRLGITGEATYAPYTSTFVVAQSDPYSTALSKIDTALQTIITDKAEEEDFVVGDAGQTLFTKTVMSDWSTLNSIVDVSVYVNGVKQKQDVTGGLNKDFRKTSNTTIEFSYTLPKYSVVTIRNERTGSPPISINVDLSNITTNVQPITNAAYSVGTSTKAWKSVFLKDSTSSQVYELKIIGGVLQVVPVP